MRYAFVPGYAPPYVIAQVELSEQSGLRLTSNLIDIEPAAVWIGMPVLLAFEHRAEGVSLPQFRLASEGGVRVY